jgi:hypothetical protein
MTYEQIHSLARDLDMSVVATLKPYIKPSLKIHKPSSLQVVEGDRILFEVPIDGFKGERFDTAVELIGVFLRTEFDNRV